GVARAGTVEVVGVVAFARHEALVLFAADRRTDSGRAHGDLLRDAFARAPLGLLLCVPLGHGLSAGRDGLDDVVVAGAAAQVAFELVANGGIVEVVALAVDHVDRGHDHAWGTIAALQPVMLAERLLHGVQRAVGIGETFDSGDVRAFDLPDEDRARFDRLAVHVHHAGTALGRVAAHVSAG